MREERRSLAPFLFVGVLLILIATPFVTLVGLAASGSTGSWPHLLHYVVPGALVQTVVLLILVALGTITIGAGTAWLVTLCQFPGRRLLQWLLILPLAVPSYIAAYCMVEFLDYSGPVQSTVRSLGGYASGREYWFPDIRSLWGAGLTFSVILYPYVFLACRLVFAMQGASALDASRTLGAGPLRTFWQIGLPMARPALAAGAALALMETLNDIGAVEFLGVRTITYAVFETWFNRDNLSGAMQLAVMALMIIAGLLAIERYGRRNRAYTTGRSDKRPGRLTLSVPKQILSLMACLLPILAGLGVPFYILGTYALRRLDGLWDGALYAAAWNSFFVAILAALLTTTIAYSLLVSYRLTAHGSLRLASQIAGLGYAVPGTVLAIGLLVPYAGFDNWLDQIMRQYFGWSTGLLISGSVALIIYACTLRFFAIAHGTLEAAFSRISPNVDMAARSLGRTPTQLAVQVHTPIMAKALGAAGLLVFVDTMKDLSATLLLRPFDFETLATLVYDRASQAALEEASLAALMIIAIGLIPIFFLANPAWAKK